jgi:hypothetical protein
VQHIQPQAHTHLLFQLAHQKYALFVLGAVEQVGLVVAEFQLTQREVAEH